jgi:hypothetical protein
MNDHPFLRTWLRVSIFMMRVLGWALIAFAVVLMALFAFGPPRDLARVLAIVGLLTAGICLVISKPVQFEKMLGYGMLGPEKVSEIRQNSRNVAPNSALQRTGDT